MLGHSDLHFPVGILAIDRPTSSHPGQNQVLVLMDLAGIWDPESDFSVIRTAWKDVMLNLVCTGTFASSFMVTMPTLSGTFPNLWLLMMLLRALSRFSWPLA